MHSSISACTQSSLFSFASRASNSREQRCLRRQRRAGDGVNKSATTATIITMPAPHHNGKPSSLTARATRRQKASAVDLESEHGRPVADRACHGEYSTHSPANKASITSASGMLAHASVYHEHPQWHLSLPHRVAKSVYRRPAGGGALSAPHSSPPTHNTAAKQIGAHTLYTRNASAMTSSAVRKSKTDSIFSQCPTHGLRLKRSVKTQHSM